jgi:hypothetical protein
MKSPFATVMHKIAVLHIIAAPLQNLSLHNLTNISIVKGEKTRPAGVTHVHQ